MIKILIFGGTTEGRKLAEILSKNANMFVTVCVATEYGAQLLPHEKSNLKVLTGRLNQAEIEQLLKNSYDFIVDSTHPYAVEITENIVQAAKNSGTKYLRLIREASNLENIFHVETAGKAVEKLQGIYGNILLTTGSKELEIFSNVKDFSSRIFPRVLPTVEAIEKCEKLGYKRSNIIAMQGPFSLELNRAIIKQFSIETLVTKDGGKQGGFTEKIMAASQENVKIIVIGRPKDEIGFGLDEIIEIVQNNRR